MADYDWGIGVNTLADNLEILNFVYQAVVNIVIQRLYKVIIMACEIQECLTVAVAKILSYDGCPEVRGEIIRTVRCCIMY